MRKIGKKLIMLIDDSSDNLQLLKSLIASYGHETCCATNGRQALSCLEELQKLPDLILLDAQMPIMDGFEFRVEQKKSQRLKNIPVVVMTADDQDSMSERMLFPRDVLTKPLSVSGLVNHLPDYLAT